MGMAAWRVEWEEALEYGREFYDDLVLDTRYKQKGKET
jgi:hypothetical protein